MAGMVRLLPCPLSHRAIAATAGGGGGGGKHAQRLLSSLQVAATSGDPSTANALIRKLVASSSKPAALQSLSRLLSLSSPLAFPVYQRIREANWFKWNPKLAAGIVSLMEKQGRIDEARTMLSESLSMLDSPRELALFYCDLIDAFSERGLKDQVLEFFARAREILVSGRRPFEAIIKGLCLMGMPKNAENMLNEMSFSGFKPSPFEFRLVLQCYGRSGAFLDMQRILRIMEETGYPVDVVCANIVLSCYGDQGELLKMVSWLKSMRQLNIGFSLRTFNAAMNSCPKVVSMMRDVGSLPLSVDGFVEKVMRDVTSANEALLVQELLNLDLLGEILEWSASDAKLDLHGFHLASAYVILLQWIEELRMRFRRNEIVPLEVSIVCGSGKHSSKVGESPVRMLVSDMMFRMKSPMRMDRKNVGRFVARGKAVSDWLC